MFVFFKILRFFKVEIVIEKIELKVPRDYLKLAILTSIL